MKLLQLILNKYEFLKIKKTSPKERANLLRSKFYHIGENVELYTLDFGTEPYLINIEDNVCVAAGVRFINHDVSCFNVARYLGLQNSSVDKVGPITLHDNCFVGAFTTLLPNSSVGKNSIVAACSVVTKHIPEGEVWGGVPAKFIMTTDEYASHVLNSSQNYPWIVNKSVTEKELIKMRQHYFFDNKKIEV